jgi:hypothetical protein
MRPPELLTRLNGDDDARRVAKLVTTIEHITHKRILCLVEVDGDGQIAVICPPQNAWVVLRTLETCDWRATRLVAEEFETGR